MIIDRRIFTFKCDYCDFVSDIIAYDRQSAIDVMRLHKWAISRDRKHCYCPSCASKARSVGCCGGYKNYK